MKKITLYLLTASTLLFLFGCSSAVDSDVTDMEKETVNEQIDELAEDEYTIIEATVKSIHPSGSAIFHHLKTIKEAPDTVKFHGECETTISLITKKLADVAALRLQEGDRVAVTVKARFSQTREYPGKIHESFVMKIDRAK